MIYSRWVNIGKERDGISPHTVECMVLPSSIIIYLIILYIYSRWVNIGKERDGMSPDAVQYARALRPPYHLLSFLRLVNNQH